ncbi:Crp/Fnr family transcriptional regulator [Sphingopyxis sp. NJF-3]
MIEGMRATCVQSALANGSWYGSLPKHVQAQIIERLKIARLGKSDMLFRQGDSPNGLHCLLDGCLHIFGLAENGDEALMAILRLGEWTAFLATLDGLPYAFEARAAEPSVIGTLPVAAVREIFEQDVATYQLLVAPQLASTRHHYRLFAEMQRPTPLQRVAYQLIALSRWPYSDIGEANLLLTRISQAQLAKSAGLSRQTINQLLRQLEAAGAVSLAYGEIRVSDTVLLRQISVRSPENI